ncbi:MAG: sulfite exporter TauE/SafE family protein [Planctomycetes bacterium]|nr:sulfite exporter TauE/SafE family protein [Planctomycetota bacterium]
MDPRTLQLALAALAGGGVGFLSGVFGAGGGFLIVPVLSIALGVPMHLAVGSSACQILGPATTSLLVRRVTRERLRLPLVICGGLLVGVALGAWLLEELVRGSASAGDNGRAEVVVLGIYFGLLLVVGTFALWEARRHAAGRPLPRGWLASLALPPLATFPQFDHRRMSLPVLGWFGLMVGLVAGLLGIGGGLILLPGLVYFLGLRTHEAVQSSLVIVWVVALQSTVAHAWNGNVDLRLVAALLVGGTVGARLGSELGTQLTGPRLRQSFGWLLIATSAFIGLRLLVLVRG